MDKDKLAERLTAAQRRYLLELEPNRIDEDASRWVRQVQREFQSRSHRKALNRPGLDTAHSLIRKGLVKSVPEPCECGHHYASLTPLGLEVQASLLRSHAQKEEGRWAKRIGNRS